MIAESFEPATIPNNEAVSAAVNLSGGRLFAIQMPGTWTTAVLTFQGSYDGSTFADLYDELGAEVSVAAAASRYIILDPARWLGLRRLKVRSGTTGTPVNQGGARTIQLILVV